MSVKSEYKVFQEILSYSYDELRELFIPEDKGNYYSFTKKEIPTHFITVLKRRRSFSPLVNADFGFTPSANSNNYPELLVVARHLTQAFDMPLDW